MRALIKQLIPIVLMLVVVVCSVLTIRNVYLVDEAAYKAEGACIAKYIAQGVERSAITAKDGVCYLN